MSLKLLFCINCFSLCVENGFCANMGNETSLRQNIMDLVTGKLNFSDANLPYDENELSDTTPKNNSEYDFIVIGAGTAGAAVASRLSEIQNVTVLLIEAGGKEYSIVDIPSLLQSLWTYNDVCWIYETESSDKYCLANKGKCTMPRGKIMGGSSSVNGMLATRGHRRDYDEWASETGDDSWSYQNMVKYFEKLEGPVRVSGNRSKIADVFIEAAKEIGLSEYAYDGPEQTGITYSRTTTSGGERCSSNRAYLRSAKGRTNLVVTQHSQVQKILIDNASKTAYGVRYSKNGAIHEVKTRKEVIVSAGTINTPQILMLSGIGLKAHLGEMKIDVIKDSPVGENLIEPIIYGRGLSFSVNDSSTIVIPNILDPQNSAVKDYVRDRSGFLSYGSSLSALAIFNANNLTDKRPNFELLLTTGNATFLWLPYLLRPRSRGKILLTSNNPVDKPKIIPNYAEDPEDVKLFINGIRRSFEFANVGALKKRDFQYLNFTSTCDSHKVGSDEYWECELRTMGASGSHSVGTCRMGRANSTNAVVDSRLNVIGVKGLRVADASIMPNVIAGHTMIPTIAIGEKAADLIKAQYGYK